MSSLDKLKKLVSRFDDNRDAYLSGQYNETQVRREFIDPFFKLLGWDIDNEQGYAEAYKDVIHEDSIKIGGATKAPDYCFRIGGTRKFFLEAKRPSVNLKEDISASYQLRRYGWSAKLPLSILTNFEGFAVYDCRIKPAQTDKVAKSRIQYFQYTDYPEKWDEIASIYSREAVLKGSFDKFVETTKTKKGTAEVDSAFLADIENWREALARNLSLRNSGLTSRQLNFSVQALIDRIIFLRMCEDRGIETYGRLQALQNGTQIYSRLIRLFREADDRYNSGLFHFNEEKDRATPPDDLTPSLTVDDKILKEIFKNLYYPDSPYEFSVLPTEILGEVYEQFLGKVIRIKGRSAVVEEKPEVKKAGGVYYTPRYIVDYIVQNTVGELLQGKKPGKRGGVDKIKILDPACGSGSFLLGAYQYLLDWYRDGYVKAGPEKHKKLLYPMRKNDWRLTTDERKRILLTHIHGVDIDPQAVEVTKLSLLLKVLEGESGETLRRQKEMFKKRALPDLGGNIKCGNSLIGPDFYQGQQMSLLDEEEQYRINAFDWQTEFKDIIQSGGFDVVIGNPPYVRQETLGEFKDYFQKHYKVYHGVADLYSYFIERGFSLLKPAGLFSYIVGNKWMRANYGAPLRRWMKQQCIEEIIDFGDLQVFQKATTYTCILRISDGSSKRKFRCSKVQHLDFLDLKSHVQKNHFQINRSQLEDSGWSLADSKTQNLLNRLKSIGTPLGDYVDRQIFYGIKTGLNEAFVIDAETRSRLIAEEPQSADLIKSFLVGKDIKRYQLLQPKNYLIFTRRGVDLNNYAAIKNHLTKFKKNLTPKPKGYDEQKNGKWEGRKPGNYKWYEIQDTVDYYEEFEKPKIIWPGISEEVNAFSFDLNNFYGNDNNQIIVAKDLYLFGLLCSNVVKIFLQNKCDKVQGGFYRLKIIYIEKIPIRVIDFSNPEEKKLHDRMVELVERMLELNKNLAEAKAAQDKTHLQRQIETTDDKIDRLVYDLYDLNEEEIALVEKANG